MTVATNTTPTTPEAPEGYISKADVLRVALAEGEKRGWCDELKDVLKNELGIEVPERPDGLMVRLTVDIPADMLDYEMGKTGWVVWDAANPGEVKLNDDEYAYGLTAAQYGAIRSAPLVSKWSDGYNGERTEVAEKAMKSIKVELIRSDEK